MATHIYEAIRNFRLAAEKLNRTRNKPYGLIRLPSGHADMGHFAQKPVPLRVFAYFLPLVTGRVVLPRIQEKRKALRATCANM